MPLAILSLVFVLGALIGMVMLATEELSDYQPMPDADLSIHTPFAATLGSLVNPIELHQLDQCMKSVAKGEDVEFCSLPRDHEGECASYSVATEELTLAE